mgnify:CR=1 FL=1
MEKMAKEKKKWFKGKKHKEKELSASTDNINTNKETDNKQNDNISTKKSNLLHSLWLLNPNNLAKEIHVYGYNFSWKTHLLLLICSLLGITVIGLLFQLEPQYLVICIIAVLYMIPTGIRHTYKKMYEEKRFEDALTYMEQMLYSFQKNEKILSALRETEDVFGEGQMKECIEEAINYLETGKSAGDDIRREALNIIQEKYSCTKMITVHELLLSTEIHGGESENSITLLIKDVENWKQRGYMLQNEKKRAHTNNIMSIAVATALCMGVLYGLVYLKTILPNISTSIDIFKVGIIQITSLLFVLCMLKTYMKSFRTQTTNVLKVDKTDDNEKLLLSDYNTVKNYDEKKERTKSLLCSVPFLIGAVVAFAYQKTILALPCIAFVIFMLNQHKIGYNIAKKKITNSLYETMPQWLMELALLLQHNNVQVSIAKTMDNAPIVMRMELEELMIRLSKEPNKITSYTDFCKDFDVPEIHSCMSMLHAISENGVGDSEQQIRNLLERINEIQDIADKRRNENATFKVAFMFQYPIAFATIKLLLDMTVGVFYLMTLLGSAATIG